MPFSTNSAGPAHILLVEDNQGFRALLQDALTMMGYYVSTADSGGKALEFLSEQPAAYHLMICDFNLWDMTACDLLQALETGENAAHIRIVIITGDPNIYHLCRDHMHRINALLEKPFPLSQLRTTVERLLQPEAG